MACVGPSEQSSGMSCLCSLLNLSTYTSFRPLIGGSLSNAADKYPELFGRWELIKTHPYFLPSFVAAAVAALGSIGGFFCLKEVRMWSTSSPQSLLGCLNNQLLTLLWYQTLPSKRHEKVEARPQSQCDTIAPEKPHPEVSIKYLLSIPVIRALCLSGSFLSFMYVLWPLGSSSWQILTSEPWQ